MLLCLTFLIPRQVLAQVEVSEPEVSTVSSSPDFTATLIQETQKPGSKEVRFIMRLSSKVASSRVKITWEVKGGSVFTEDSTPSGTLSIQPDQSYDIPITIIPTPLSATELYGKAEAFLADGTLITTVRTNFSTNEFSEVLPLTDEYLSDRSSYKTYVALQTVGISSLVIVVLVFIAIRFMKYLKRDDQKAYEQRRSGKF